MAGALALTACLPAALARTEARAALSGSSGDANGYSVTVEQCVSSSVQAERSVTFAAQMVATGATQKMAMRIDLEQRRRGEAAFHLVLAPGLGVWRGSEPGVKIYKYLKQVTNLTAPATYRAVVHLRWVADKGRVIKRAELYSSRCFQPTLSAQMKAAPGA